MTRDNVTMQIFIARDGDQIGVWPEAEVRQMYKSGKLMSTDHFWREGMDGWDVLENLPATPPPKALPAKPAPASPAVQPERSGSRPRRRSSLIWGTFPIAVAIVFFALVGVIFIRRHQAAENIVSKINADAALQRQEEAEKPATNMGVAASSQTADGSEQKIKDAAMDVTQQISTKTTAYQTVELQMQAIGLSPDKITSLDELEKRRAAVQACQPPLQDLIDYLKNRDAHSRDRLTAQGVAPADIDSFITGLDHTGNAQAEISYWQLESAILNDLMTNLDLLKANWGKWHTDNGTLVFDDSATLAAYNANQKKIEDDVAAQSTAQQAVASATPGH